MAMPRRPLRVLHQLRVDVGRIADRAVADVVKGWLRGWDVLSPRWQRAVSATVEQAADRGPMAPWQIARLPEVASAVRRTEVTLGALSTASVRSAQSAVSEAVAVTEARHPQLLEALGADVAVTGRLPAGAGDQVAVQARAQVARAMNPLAGDVGTALQRSFLRAVATRTARSDASLKAVFDAGTRRAVATTQTATLDGYRDMAARVDAASTVVTGWLWISALDLSSCSACWVMHGTLHPTTEPGPLDHPCGRCARLPVIGEPPTVVDAQKKFRRLPRDQQAKILGPNRLRLFLAGDVRWADLATRQTGNGWRDTYTPTPLADLTRR